MRLIMSAIIGMLFIFEAHGRCSGTAADHILNEAVNCGEQKRVSIYDLENPPHEVEQKILRVCMDGCSVLGNGKKANCDERYASSLLGAEESIKQYANSNDCDLDFDQVREVAGQAESNSKPRGCEFIGDYSKKIVKPSVVTRCGGAPRNAVVCRTDIHCNPGSQIHKDYGYEGEGSIEFELTCVGDAQGSCPDMKSCIEDEGYKSYDGGEVVKNLPSESTSGGGAQEK